MATPVIFPVIIVKQYERMVPFRLGKFFGLKGAGLRLLIPFVDSFQKVDLREDVIDVARQTNITKDKAPIDIDFLIYYKVLDHEAVKSVLEVQDFRAAIVGMATTTLRAVVGDIPLDDVLAKREEINQILRVKLDEVTGRWGVKVTAVEIREIDPPAEIQHAMNRQMAGRAGTQGRGHRGRRPEAGKHNGGRGPEAGRDPKRGGSAAVGDPAGRGPQAGGNSECRGIQQCPGPDLQGGPGGRREDYEPAVLRDAEGHRGEPLDQVHLPHGVHECSQAVHEPGGNCAGGRFQRDDVGRPQGGLGRVSVAFCLLSLDETFVYQRDSGAGHPTHSALETLRLRSGRAECPTPRGRILALKWKLQL